MPKSKHDPAGCLKPAPPQRAGMEEKRTYPNVKTEEPEFQELTRIRGFDRNMHVQKLLEMGMSREEAERHADEHLRERRDDME